MHVIDKCRPSNLDFTLTNGMSPALPSQGARPDSRGIFLAVYVNVSASVNATGLGRGTEYDIYLVAKDAVGNKQSSVTSIL